MSKPKTTIVLVPGKSYNRKGLKDAAKIADHLGAISVVHGWYWTDALLVGAVHFASGTCDFAFTHADSLGTKARETTSCAGCRWGTRTWGRP